MKSLLYKELKLATHPTTYLFLALSTMMLIPSYPYYIQFMYICLSIFFLFLAGRENKDILYSVLLPVRKKDIVKARCLMMATIQLAQILVSIPFAIISVSLLPNGANLAGIDANLAFYGFVFLMFSVFNITFIPIFYKSAYKVAMTLLYSGIAIILFYLAVEALIWFPSPIQNWLDTSNPAMMIKHLPILLFGLITWVLTLFLANKLAAKNFEKVDI